MSLSYLRHRLHAEIDVAGIVGHEAQHAFMVVGYRCETKRRPGAVLYPGVGTLLVYLGQRDAQRLAVFITHHQIGVLHVVRYDQAQYAVALAIQVGRAEFHIAFLVEV